MFKSWAVGPGLDSGRALWAVMGWWDLDMSHQGSVGLALRQGTQDDVLGLVFGQPKGEKSSWAVISEKVQKGQFCALSL